MALYRASVTLLVKLWGPGSYDTPVGPGNNGDVDRNALALEGNRPDHPRGNRSPFRYHFSRANTFTLCSPVIATKSACPNHSDSFEVSPLEGGEQVTFRWNAVIWGAKYWCSIPNSIVMLCYGTLGNHCHTTLPHDSEALCRLSSQHMNGKGKKFS